MGRVKNGINPFFPPQRGEFVPPAIKEALTEEQTISRLVSSDSTITLLSPCLCSHCLPTRQYSISVFYLKHVAVFQSSNFREQVQCGSVLILWGRVWVWLHCVWFWFFPEKQSYDHMGLRVYVKVQPKAVF